MSYLNAASRYYFLQESKYGIAEVSNEITSSLTVFSLRTAM